jgi:hypothetical protein
MITFLLLVAATVAQIIALGAASAGGGISGTAFDRRAAFLFAILAIVFAYSSGRVGL